VSEGQSREVGERLLLRPPGAADEAGYLDVFLRPEVVAWLRPAPLPPITVAEVQAMLGDDVRHWAEDGFGPWALIDRPGGAYLGRAGLRWTRVEGSAVIELAWTVAPDRQNEGLASTAARAGIDLAADLGLEEIIALALPGNGASRRVAEKVGMELSGEVEHAGLPHVLYRLRLG
jgi:RimJ/RimL family protein N-acetyltransferase